MNDVLSPRVLTELTLLALLAVSPLLYRRFVARQSESASEAAQSGAWLKWARMTATPSQGYSKVAQDQGSAVSPHTQGVSLV